MDEGCFVDSMFPGEFSQEESDILSALMQDMEWDSGAASYPYSAIRTASVRSRLAKVKNGLNPEQLSVLRAVHSLPSELVVEYVSNLRNGMMSHTEAFDLIRESAKAAASKLSDIYCDNLSVKTA